MAYFEINFEPRDGRDDSALHLAAFHPKCDVDLVKTLLEMGVHVNTANALGQTPLHYMIKYKPSLDIIKLLLDNGALVNKLDDFNESPLHYALHGCQYNPVIVRLLLESGANVDEPNEDEEQPLHFAAKLCDLDAICMLLEKGADVNALDIRDESPLHHALNALVCDPRVIQLLLDNRADIFQGNENGQQPLHLAAYKCNACIVKLLLDYGALVNSIDISFQSPLSHALNAVECDPEVVDLLLKSGADVRMFNYNGEQILHLAAYKCNQDIIQLLLDHGASVNELDFSLRTPLHCALSINDINPEVVKLLVNAGSDLSHGDRIGHQPLHLACFLSDPDTVKLLLDHGAPPNALNMLRCTPLLNAVLHIKDGSKRAILKSLLESGAKVFRGLSPLLMAGYLLNEEHIRTNPETFSMALQNAKLLIKYGVLERPMIFFKGICTDLRIDKFLLHYNMVCLLEMSSKCPGRNFLLGQFIMQQRQNEVRDVDEILQVFSKRPYPFYKEVIAGLLTKQQLREKLEEQIERINMSCFNYPVTLNHVVLHIIVRYISDRVDLLNLSLAFYGIS